MADDIGVRVWRFQYHDAHERNDLWRTGEPMEFSEPYLAIPLDAESLAGLRERIAHAIADTWLVKAPNGTDYRCADAVLAALGLTA